MAITYRPHEAEPPVLLDSDLRAIAESMAGVARWDEINGYSISADARRTVGLDFFEYEELDKSLRHVEKHGVENCGAEVSIAVEDALRDARDEMLPRGAFPVWLGERPEHSASGPVAELSAMNRAGPVMAQHFGRPVMILAAPADGDGAPKALLFRPDTDAAQVMKPSAEIVAGAIKLPFPALSGGMTVDELEDATDLSTLSADERPMYGGRVVSKTEAAAFFKAAADEGDGRYFEYLAHLVRCHNCADAPTQTHSEELAHLSGRHDEIAERPGTGPALVRIDARIRSLRRVMAVERNRMERERDAASGAVRGHLGDAR